MRESFNTFNLATSPYFLERDAGLHIISKFARGNTKYFSFKKIFFLLLSIRHTYNTLPNGGVSNDDMHLLLPEKSGKRRGFCVYFRTSDFHKRD